jgi:hypothetical protein
MWHPKITFGVLLSVKKAESLLTLLPGYDAFSVQSGNIIGQPASISSEDLEDAVKDPS